MKLGKILLLWVFLAIPAFLAIDLPVTVPVKNILAVQDLDNGLSAAERRMAAQVFETVYNVSSLSYQDLLKNIKADNPDISEKEIKRRLELK